MKSYDFWISQSCTPWEQRVKDYLVEKCIYTHEIVEVTDSEKCSTIALRYVDFKFFCDVIAPWIIQEAKRFFGEHIHIDIHPYLNRNTRLGRHAYYKIVISKSLAPYGVTFHRSR